MYLKKNVECFDCDMIKSEIKIGRTDILFY